MNQYNKTCENKFTSSYYLKSNNNKITKLPNLNRLKEDFYNENNSSKSAFLCINLTELVSIINSYDYRYFYDITKELGLELNKLANNNISFYKGYEFSFIYFVKDLLKLENFNEFEQGIKEIVFKYLFDEPVTVGIGVIKFNSSDNFENTIKKGFIAASYAIKNDKELINTKHYNSKIEEIYERENLIKHEFSNMVRDNVYENLNVYFQPIISIKNQKIYAYEALARYNSYVLGPISPVEFIPILEKTKLIIQIGRKIIDDSLDFLKKVNEKDPLIKVSINVSIIHLIQDDFLEMLFEKIEYYKVDSKNIIIETTETISYSRIKDIKNIIIKLREAGVMVAIDDFGTGNSSLILGMNLNVDIIKIDRSFISNINNPLDNGAIVTDIISIGHRLNQIVVGEGVETREQLDYLTNNNCDLVQGYFFQKGTSQNEALEYLINFKYDSIISNK